MPPACSSIGEVRKDENLHSFPAALAHWSQDSFKQELRGGSEMSGTSPERRRGGVVHRGWHPTASATGLGRRTPEVIGATVVRRPRSARRGRHAAPWLDPRDTDRPADRQLFGVAEKGFDLPAAALTPRQGCEVSHQVIARHIEEVAVARWPKRLLKPTWAMTASCWSWLSRK